MKKELALALLPLVLLLGSSSGQPTTPCPPDNFPNVDVTYDDVRKTSIFGLDLFRALKAQVPQKNLFFSPYSVWSALAIAYFGAEGNTLAQLQSALKLGEKDAGYKAQRVLSITLRNNTGVQLLEANRAYFASYLALEECFQRGDFHDVRQFEFSDAGRLAQEVNGFVSKTTRGLIPKLVSANSLRRTTFFLVNAVYFKGFWERQFNKVFTRPEDFFCNPGRPCGQVEMMQRDSDINYVNNTNLGAEVIELPYKDSSISMLLFLPWENVNTVDGVVDRLDLPALAATVSSLNLQFMILKFPKFKMEQTLIREMQAAIGDLGVTDLFSKRADLSAFTKSADLSADTIIHKAVVDVNEEGTEAAAATAIFPVRIGGIPPPPLIVFNRPFVFLIVDKSLGLTLFGGIFRSPPSGAQP